MNDLKFAIRQLFKNPGFTAVAILTLALGIGSCAAMFSMVNAVLWRPLPFQDPNRLVWIENKGTDGLSARTTRVDNFQEWVEQNRTFDSLGAYFAFFDYQRFTFQAKNETSRLRGVGITQNLLDVLGVKPVLGRNFSKEECTANGPKAVILSHAFWQRQFAGEKNIIGQALNINGSPTEVVGVAPPTFDFTSIFSPGTEVQLLLPFPLNKQTASMGNTIFAIGRLKPSVNLSAAQADLDLICQRLTQSGRDPFGARLSTLESSIRGSIRQSLIMLFGAVGCVLLIVCANLSNLLLARANGRRKEFAVRAALGAGRWHLIRQTMTESMLLSLGGCALGAPLAFTAIQTLSQIQTFSIPLLQTATMDTTALLFTAGLTAVAGILCSVLPAINIGFGCTQKHLQESTTRGSEGRSAARARTILIIAEIGTACVLLTGAGLLIQSFANLLNVNLGFEPRHAMSWRVDPVRGFKSPNEATAYYDDLARRVGALPGVESVGLSDTLPLGRNRTWGIAAKGVSYTPENYPTAFPRLVDHQYLQTMNIPLRAGRYFDLRDTGESAKVIIINETAAHYLWPDRDAVGQTILANESEWTVIGVVGNVRHGSVEEAGGAEMYFNYRQLNDWGALELVARSSRPVEALIPEVRNTIKNFDPQLPTMEFTTLGEIVDHAVAPRKLITQTLGAFAALALALAAIGLYGVLAHSVGQRTREIGIRLALGSQRSWVLGLIVREGFIIAMIGITIGLVASYGVTHILRSLLFGVGATDPFIFAITAGVLMVVTLLACAIPAHRASRVDPMEALRTE